MCDQELNLKFVREVEKHEELYNYKLPGYSRRDVTEKAWQEIASIMNMTAPECKEKWRNLRTVFMRKMKPKEGKKKAYYLETAMQFCLPFVKTTAPLSLNFPPRVCSINDVEVVENPEMSCDSERFTYIPDKNQSRNIEDVEECVVDYFKAKKAKMDTIESKIDRQKSIQMFLLSLIPELEELNDTQIKFFKRRVFTLIDEITS